MPATLPAQPLEAVEDRYYTSADIRRRFQVGDMWIFRRLHDDSGFPQPVVVKRRRYWKLSELLAWERKHLAAVNKPTSRSARR